MDIQTYRQKNGLSQEGFAALLTKHGCRASQGLVWQWENGKTRITAEKASDIEKATRGGITRHDLRPDLWAKGEAAA